VELSKQSIRASINQLSSH